MATTLTANPLFARLTRNARWPSLRATLALTGVLSLLSVLVAAYWMSRTEALLAEAAAQDGGLRLRSMSWERLTLPPMGGTLLFLPGMVLVLTPIVVTGAAFILALREVRDKQAYQLLHLSLAPQAIVHGLLLAALYRVRALLALTVVLVPFLSISPYQNAQRVGLYGCFEFVTAEGLDQLEQRQRLYQCTDPPDSRFLLAAIAAAVEPAIGSWGISLLGAALAIGLALWWRRADLVALGLLATLVVLTAVPTLLGPPTGHLYPQCAAACKDCVRCTQVWPPHAADFIWLPVPYGLAWAITWVARRWA